MKRIFFTLISVFMLLSCNNSDESFTPQQITPIQIAKGELVGNNLGNISQQNVLITNQTSFNNLINSLNTVHNVSHLFTETTVDFSNYMIIAVINEIKPTGSSINIANITENSNYVTVTLQESEFDSMMPTRAFHIVKIPIVTKPFVFQ